MCAFKIENAETRSKILRTCKEKWDQYLNRMEVVASKAVFCGNEMRGCGMLFSFKQLKF